MVAITNPGANVSSKNKRTGIRSDKPRCDWCTERFKPSRRDQRYCTGNCRRDACERRKLETIATLTVYFAAFGLSAEHIGICADYDLSRLRNILVMLGFSYSEQLRKWSSG